nr:zinc finger, CCHC-type [Tanacetum cinerariifolium]
MITSAVNNSVFRGFFEKQKLTGPNFIDWYRQLRIVLSVEDKLNYLEHPISVAHVPAQAGQQVAPEALATHAAWVKGSKEITKLMLMTMDLEIQQNLENLGAYEMLQELKTLFAQQAEQELLQTIMGKTINELHAMLKLHEQTVPKNNALVLHAIRRKNKLPYAPKPKIPPPPKREDPDKDSVCHQCGETGHWKKNCPQYLAELLKNKKLSQGASGSDIFTIELYSFPNKSWVYDTGCGSHICNTTQDIRGSRKLKPGTLSLYVGNGQRAAIEAIGSYHLSLPSELVIVLNNCHYASSITRGIVSVFRLYFEKCVPCMSGKMARKPYLHQVERAKDLPGLIHTDVCGPFKIVPRQGASYFVTFTDDFNHYGYVYLLKHKHEMFETFKVFQKEVENPLGKTIKSLRSDRGCEYMSQEFLDHLEDHGIIAHCTPPYMPQHNGVSERPTYSYLS